MSSHAMCSRMTASSASVSRYPANAPSLSGPNRCAAVSGPLRWLIRRSGAASSASTIFDDGVAVVDVPHRVEDACHSGGTPSGGQCRSAVVAPITPTRC